MRRCRYSADESEHPQIPNGQARLNLRKKLQEVVSRQPNRRQMISSRCEVFYNMGAKGEEGQRLLGGDPDSEKGNMGYAMAITAGIRAAFCNPDLKRIAILTLI